MMGIDRNPEFLVRKDVQHFGLQSVRHYPWRVQELYADAANREAQSTVCVRPLRHTDPHTAKAQSGMTVQIRTGPIPCALSHETTAQLSMAKCVNDAAALKGVLWA
jgi:hypothetical protein